MIPPTKQQNLNWASRYEDIPRLTQSYIEDRLAASRTEKHTYLIEEEGEFTLPEIILNYYNFQTRKWNQVSLNEKNALHFSQPRSAGTKIIAGLAKSG
jgi:hypothetical protein